MPNHVTNKLLFHPCTEQRFNEILADLQKEGAEPGSIDLGRIIPEPEGLFMGDLGVEEMKKYKDNNWYDWRIKHWNTKWNAYGFEPPAFSGDTGTMTFRTANCSPFPVIFKLSQKYPDVEIDLRYADEDIGYNVGEITVCAGELIDDNSPQYGSATAQELAADILGLNLDFDLNTGSGYVVSLLGNYYEKETCVDCGRELTKDEIALNKKLISLDLMEFRCLECLSVSFGCEVEDLKIKIDEFKEQGCTLFV